MEARWSTALIALGLFLTGFSFTLLYPSIGDLYSQMIEILPESLSAFVGEANLGDTPEGFLSIELFSFTAPVITIAYAISRGVRSVATEEEASTLDQLLANPITRSSVVIQKSLALATTSLIPIVALAISIPIGAAVMDFPISWSGSIAMNASLYLLTLATGFLALAAGAVSGKNSIAMAVPFAVAVVGVLVNFLVPLTTSFSFTKYISLLHYYEGNDPFLNGLDPWHASALAAVSIVSVAIAIYRFNYRDLH